MWNWKQELSLDFYIILAWITWHPFFWAKARGLSKLKIHIEIERAKVNRAFWLKIMWRDNWTCYLCGRKIPFGQAELEHNIPLVRMGYTTEKNCYASDRNCNRAKGTKTAQEYLATK